jgi:hypothetical protein
MVHRANLVPYIRHEVQAMATTLWLGLRRWALLHLAVLTPVTGKPRRRTLLAINIRHEPLVSVPSLHMH